MMVRLTDQSLIRKRDRILSELARRNIGVSVHFIPLHTMTHFRRHYGCKPGDFPQAEASFRATMSLPFYPAMTRDTVRHVVDTLRSVMHHLG